MNVVVQSRNWRALRECILGQGLNFMLSKVIIIIIIIIIIENDSI